MNNIQLNAPISNDQPANNVVVVGKKTKKKRYKRAKGQYGSYNKHLSYKATKAERMKIFSQRQRTIRDKMEEICEMTGAVGILYLLNEDKQIVKFMSSELEKINDEIIINALKEGLKEKNRKREESNKKKEEK